jgi:hypothetical protein
MIKKLMEKDRKLGKTFLVCIAAFIVIPLTIYALSYILFPNVVGYTNNSNNISGIVQQSKDMYHYHSTLTETHPFQSSWYEWPFMHRPVWLYANQLDMTGEVVSTIVGIGNPFIWWFGVIAFIATLIKTFIKKEREDFFILVFILCSYVPYIFIGRAMFMYHYFPTLPFVMLAIVSFMKYITEKTKTNMYLKFYIALIVITFFVFYPVSSGMITTSEYVDALKYMAILFPICLYEGRMSLLNNTYLKAMRCEKNLLIINIVAVAVSLLMTVITVVIFHDLIFCVISIVIIFAFRCYFAEWYLTRLMRLEEYKYLFAEIGIVSWFMYTSWMVDGVWGIVCYCAILSLYLGYEKKSLTDAWRVISTKD